MEKLNLNKVLPALFTFIVMGFVDLVGLSVGYAKEEFNLSDFTSSWLPMAVFLWFFLLSVPVGIIQDKRGKKNTMLAGIAVTGLGMLLGFFSYSFPILLIAMVLGLGIYQGSLRISLRSFFKWTSAFLILVAAGMVAYRIHELQEAGLLLIGPIEVWNINPPVLPDGSYPLFHDKGLIGGLLKAMFGYNGNPSFLEVSGYVLYLLILAGYYTYQQRTPHSGIAAKAHEEAPTSVNV